MPLTLCHILVYSQERLCGVSFQIKQTAVTVKFLHVFQIMSLVRDQHYQRSGGR